MWSVNWIHHCINGHRWSLNCLLRRRIFPPLLVFGWPPLHHQFSPCYSLHFLPILFFFCALGQDFSGLTSGTASLPPSLFTVGASEWDRQLTPHFLLPSLALYLSALIVNAWIPQGRAGVGGGSCLWFFFVPPGALEWGFSHFLNVGDGTQAWDFWYSAFTSYVWLAGNANGHITNLEIVVPCTHKALNIAVCHIHKDDMLYS